jgi:hypothetical protein
MDEYESCSKIMVFEMLVTNKTNVSMNICQLLVEVYK